MEISVISKFQPQKRWILVLALALILFIVIFYYLTPDTVQQDNTIHVQNPTIAAGNSKSDGPKVYKAPNKQPPTRDPFEQLPGYQASTSSSHPAEPSTGSNSSMPRNPVSVNVSKMQLNRPVLEGVVGTDNQRVAIIRRNGESRVYNLNEYIDGYRLVSISDSNVTLRGATS